MVDSDSLPTGAQLREQGAAPEPAAAPDEDGETAAALAVDGAGLVLHATPAAAVMLECDAADLVGSSLQDLVAKEWFWVVRNALLRVASGSSTAFELLLVGRAGRRTLVQMVPHPWPTAGQPRGYLLECLEQSRAAEATATPTSEQRLRRLAYELLKSQDLERRRVAAELHESITPLVVTAKMMTEVAAAALARGAYAEAAVILASTAARLRETLAVVSRISSELEPRSLDDLGLLPTIEWYCRTIGDAYPGLRIALDLSAGEEYVAWHLKVDIFRVVQEALLNVGRHACATEARVTLARSDGRLHLLVQDDGLGFDVAPFQRDEENTRGLGLHSIRKRVAATGGTLHMQSAPGQGTTIEACWALPTAT